MSNQPHNPGNTSEDSGAPRVSTSSGQDDTSKNEAAAAPRPAQDQPTNAATTSTQSNMGNGDGIRGEYGDASQTNGMEGGNKDEADPRQNNN